MMRRKRSRNQKTKPVKPSIVRSNGEAEVVSSKILKISLEDIGTRYDRRSVYTSFLFLCITYYVIVLCSVVYCQSCFMPACTYFFSWTILFPFYFYCSMIKPCVVCGEKFWILNLAEHYKLVHDQDIKNISLVKEVEIPESGGDKESSVTSIDDR